MLKEECKNVNADDFTALCELNKRVRELEKELEAERKKNASLSDIINRFVADNPEIPPAEKVEAVYVGRGEGVPPREYVPVIRCEHCKHCKMVVDIIGDPHLFCGLSSNNAAVQFGDFCSYGEKKEATP